MARCEGGTSGGVALTIVIGSAVMPVFCRSWQARPGLAQRPRSPHHGSTAPLTLWTCSSPAHHSSGPVPATLFRSLASRRVKVAQRTDLALTCVKKRSFQRHGDVEKL